MAAKISVIIPTHNAKWLLDTLASVAAQTLPAHEVILVPNGDVTLPHLPENLPIRLVPYSGTRIQIGALKRFGFDAATGDVLVELDHDDLFTPDCLEKLDTEVTRGAEFVYSSTAEFWDETWKPHLYSADWGWKHRAVRLFDRDLIEMVAFEPMPSSVCYIWWSANHVRAWTRGIYQKSGGHDPTMPVGDDHDVVIRTFLACEDWQKQFRRYDGVLYAQRMYNESTSRTPASFGVIQDITRKLYAENIFKIVHHWAKGLNLPCYDLGGAHGKLEGWEPIDLALGGPDLTKPWPWQDSSVGAFRAFDFLEHLPDKQHTMHEIHRCLVPGGWLLSLTPASDGIGADCDPTHVSYWNERSFLYYTDRALAKYIDNTTTRFQRMRLVRHTLEFRHDWLPAAQVPYITFDGIAVKGDWRGPGELRI